LESKNPKTTARRQFHLAAKFQDDIYNIFISKTTTKSTFLVFNYKKAQVSSTAELKIVSGRTQSFFVVRLYVCPDKRKISITFPVRPDKNNEQNVPLIRHKA